MAIEKHQTFIILLSAMLSFHLKEMHYGKELRNVLGVFVLFETGSQTVSQIGLEQWSQGWPQTHSNLTASS